MNFEIGIIWNASAISYLLTKSFLICDMTEMDQYLPITYPTPTPPKPLSCPTPIPITVNTYKSYIHN